MFVTQNLRDKVSFILSALEVRAQWLVDFAEKSEPWQLDACTCWAAERALHIAIECSTDAANDVIDALVMREPGGYTDIIRVIAEEGVVTRAWFEQYESVLVFRDKLVHGYKTLTPEDVKTAVRTYSPLFLPYVEMVKRYLEIT